MSKQIRKKKQGYTDGPMGQMEIEFAEDFLPPPHVLVRHSKLKKITLSITEGSFAFFKKEADTLGTSYQKIIREVLSSYVDHHLRQRYQDHRANKKRMREDGTLAQLEAELNTEVIAEQARIESSKKRTKAKKSK